ncbi:ABC transporter permease [Hoeflea alexandrii]|uniref:ABC transporter permease n=1 Tax=Hoeflea alexandrii TaxID=288436 RepID=UPI0022AFE931|nr:ABC transporter permease [Hoeflea alexandrii]MCZ4291007.1 ABC transporter permease [Hoeflea alexandrii]
MLIFTLRRILATIPVMLAVALFIFVLLYLAPGDPAEMIAGDNASAAEIEQVRELLGLNQPFLVRFADWTAGLLRGDLGVSVFSRKPVTELILQRLEPTFSLMATTLIISITAAIPMGVIAAARAGSWIDRAIMGTAVLGFSVPVFATSYALSWIFSIQLNWLPVQGYQPLSEGLWAWFRHLIIPSIALGSVYMALIARITRTSMLEVLNQDYIRTAMAKGQSRTRILFEHALKNAAVSILTVIGLGVALLIGGAVVTESVFSIPGIGRLTVDAILQRDYPVIQGVVLFFSFVYVLINLAVDLAYRLFDPRIRL